MARKWPAYQKWTMDYMKEVVGDVTVPLYDSSKADPAAPINAPTSEMKFADYIDLIQREPTDLRIFFFDPIKKANKLLDDYISPKELMGGFLDKFPSMFFGGKGSVTFLHYDIDLAHIFHTHFNGRKHILLFDYKWKDRLYKLPYATYALEDFDISNPDFEKFPALDGVEGIECFLEHGDTLFMPDVGTARCDFPGGDAKTLYASTRKILSLPPTTRLFMCHDYPPNGRAVKFETTVADQRANNIHVKDSISEEAFVEMRTKRDATLEMPVLILPAVQINIRAGELPPKEDNGIAYAKIPLNAL